MHSLCRKSSRFILFFVAYVAICINHYIGVSNSLIAFSLLASCTNYIPKLSFPMATEHHSWFKSALPEQHKALSEFIKSQAVNGDDFTVSMSEIAASAVFSSWVVTIVLIVLAFLGRGALNKATSRTNELERYEADSGFGLRNIFEMYVDLSTILLSNIGKKDARKFFWLPAVYLSIFLTILLVRCHMFCNPKHPNNFSMAIVVSYFCGIGIIRTGSGFFKHMAGPIWWIAPLILSLGIGTFIVRPLTLSIRLTGNINGDHKVWKWHTHF